jgi:hypothetical protein
MTEKVKKKRKRRTKAEMEEARRLEAEQKEKPKRKRRTKAEMEEARKAEKKKKSKKPKISWWDVENNCHFYTTEEICDIKLKEALDKGLEEPYFDYRLDYEAGNRIWFININALTKQAHIDELTIGTVYPRMIMGRLEKGETVTIPYEEREFIFSTPKDAEKKFKELKKKGKKNDW